MANERMYLVHKPSGYYVSLGKRMGWGWYGTPDDIKERLEKLFLMVETQEAEGDQDDFEIAMEGDAVLKIAVMSETNYRQPTDSPPAALPLPMA